MLLLLTMHGKRLSLPLTYENNESKNKINFEALGNLPRALERKWSQA